MSAPIVERLRADAEHARRRSWPSYSAAFTEAADTIEALLEALKALHEIAEVWVNAGDWETAYLSPQAVLSQVERAIAKAEGGQ